MVKVSFKGDHVVLTPDKPCKQVIIYTKWGVRKVTEDVLGRLYVTMDEKGT